MSADLDRLQGIWRVTSLETDGQPTTAAGDARIVVTGNRFESLGMGFEYEGEMEIDPRARPRSFDIVFTRGHAKGTRNVGIYKLEPEQWTICLATQGTTRPNKFESKSNTGLVLEVLQRQGPPAKATKRQRGVKETEAVSASPTVLEGEWAMIGAVFNGAPMDKRMMEFCKRVTRGNVTTVTAGPQVMLKATFTLSGSGKHDIDYMNVEGANKGKTQAGIFSVKSDTLEVCMAAPGGPRPSEFSSQSGDGRSYTTWKLVQK